jgi:lipid-binding SYLF domain-containing protein
MRRTLAILLLVVAGASAGPGRVHAGDKNEDKDKAASAARLDAAATVLQEVIEARDKSIPLGLLDKSHCVVIVPGLKKGAFIIGAKYGKGCISCRRQDGKGWSAPGTVRIEGGSVGFQFGGQESDVVLLVMNERGVERLLSSKFTLGADAAVAAGPVGRDARAETDAMLTAEILSWSRSRGAFAGVSLSGATLREDLDDNRALYGRTLENKEIVLGEIAAPEAAQKLLELLTKHSPQRVTE